MDIWKPLFPYTINDIRTFKIKILISGQLKKQKRKCGIVKKNLFDLLKGYFWKVLLVW